MPDPKDLPLADVLTPNIPEAEKIADMKITSVKEMEEAARKIQALGCVGSGGKGRSCVGSALDVLFDGRNLYHFDAPGSLHPTPTGQAVRFPPR